MARSWLVAAAATGLLVVAACGRMPAPVAHADGPTAPTGTDPSATLAGAPEAVPPQVAPDPGGQAPRVTPVKLTDPPGGFTSAKAAGAAVHPAPASPGTVGDVQPPSPMTDPLEPMSRQFYRLDALANRVIAGRTSLVSRLLPRLPKGGARLVQNAIDNAQEPTTFANQVLQRRVVPALRTVLRFAVNSTAGLLGARDVAARLGLKRVQSDFGKTLARYGVAPGPYLYLPLRGPANVRDAAGVIIDSYAYPLHWLSLGSSSAAASLRNAYNASRATTMAVRVTIRADRLSKAPAAQASDGYALTRTDYVRSNVAGEPAHPAPTRPPGGPQELAMQRDAAPSGGAAADGQLAALPAN